MEFDSLVTEGAEAPTEGWDFSWFEGRATEQRPPWGYAVLLSQCLTESWPPNAALAISRLGVLRTGVVRAADGEALPFADESFDLVSSRHPVVVLWGEIARVLREGSTFVSQMVGAGSNRELYEYFMGPQEQDASRSLHLPFEALLHRNAKIACWLQRISPSINCIGQW
jgi:SAM-dependent methyltransferase